jgi:hypothetical protein
VLNSCGGMSIDIVIIAVTSEFRHSKILNLIIIDVTMTDLTKLSH